MPYFVSSLTEMSIFLLLNLVQLPELQLRSATESIQPVKIVVFLASGQYTLSMRTYAPFRNVVRSNQRHDKNDLGRP